MADDETRLGGPAVRALLLVAAALCVVGWIAFRFLTDDAFIAFRYVSNRQLGYGYVWNPPPFLPVEGYTSFLWVVLLDLAWTVTGVEPPLASNVLSLMFSIGSLALLTVMLVRLCRGTRLEPFRAWLVGLSLALVVSNPTFLAWTSSGLETAMFNFLVQAWLLACWRVADAPGRWLGPAAGLAALLALTRPDGLLFTAATLFVFVLLLASPGRGGLRPRALLLRSAPLVAVLVHVLWRRAVYGEWLPNTYYAKHIAPWPEAGVRYLASFVLEYALWIPLLVIAAGLVRAGLDAAAASGGFVERLRSPQRVAPWVAAAAVTGQIGYYTLRVGGDHFEYCVLNHVVPLVPLLIVWSALRLRLGPRLAVGLLALSLAAGLPLPWTHWSRARERTTRSAAMVMIVPVSDAFPAALRWYTGAFDRLQAWLIERHVGMRYQEHKVYWQHLSRILPSREQGAAYRDGQSNVVILSYSVGLIGWVYPHAAVIDALGLNDHVVARTPPPAAAGRYMAHDRVPPPGYLDSFAPSLIMTPDSEIYEPPRRPLLTDDQIRQVELRYRRWLDRVRH